MNYKVISVVFAVSFVAIAAAGPVVDDSKGHINLVQTNEPSIEESLLKKLNTKCVDHDVSSCMMLKLVTYFNRLMKKSNIDMGEIEITQTSTETVNYDTGRSLNDIEKMSEEEQMSQFFVDKASNFIRTRSLKWKMLDGADLVVSGRSKQDGTMSLDLSLRPSKDGVEEGRKKKNNNMQGIMAAILMKAALLKALAFKALVLLVGKALLVSKLALVLAAIIGLKKLFHQEKHVTYEVVAHPHHEHVHEAHHVEHGHSGGGYDGGHGGGWGRNFDGQAAQNLAYSAHVPTN